MRKPSLAALTPTDSASYQRCKGDVNGCFDAAYNNAAVAQQSVFFSPADIGVLPDDKAHSIAYKSGLPIGYFCSEPKTVKASAFHELSTIFMTQFEEKRFDQIGEAAREMRESVLEVASSTIRQTEQRIAARMRSSRVQVSDGTPKSPEEERAIIDILVAREIARVDLGIDLLVAQPR